MTSDKERKKDYFKAISKGAKYALDGKLMGDLQYGVMLLSLVKAAEIDGVSLDDAMAAVDKQEINFAGGLQ